MRKWLRGVRKWLGWGCWCCGKPWEIASVVSGKEYHWCRECKFVGCKDCS